jgi:hypothetical protein
MRRMTDDEIKDEIDELTEQLQTLMSMREPEEPPAPLEVRAVERQRERMKNRLAAKAEHPPAPLSAELIDHLLAESAALAAGGELNEALSVAKIAEQIARAAKLTGRLQSESELTRALVRFDQSPNENGGESATIQVSITAAKASLSRLVVHAMRGDTVIIERNGRRVVRLVPEPFEDEFTSPPKREWPPLMDLS